MNAETGGWQHHAQLRAQTDFGRPKMLCDPSDDARLAQPGHDDVQHRDRQHAVVGEAGEGLRYGQHARQQQDREPAQHDDLGARGVQQ